MSLPWPCSMDEKVDNILLTWTPAIVSMPNKRSPTVNIIAHAVLPFEEAEMAYIALVMDNWV